MIGDPTMAEYLCISVTLLDRLFHGKGEGNEPEWPPSPMRLFQALIAGARAGCRAAAWDTRHARAFRWLEGLGAPLIIAPRVQPGTRCTYFVPNNEGDVKFERQDRLKSKVAQPYYLLDGDTIHYIWPIGDTLEAETICEEARHILALGWGIDQAVGRGRILGEEGLAALRGERWRPWKLGGNGTKYWRVPSPGSLEDIEECYKEFSSRVEGKKVKPLRKPKTFERFSYLRSLVMPPRYYAVFELPEGVAFRPERANEVAAMLRSLACRCAKADTHEFPGGAEVYVAGHVEERNGQTPERFSYLPLPTIGHEHVDGLIRRLLIAEPFGGDGTHAAWAQQRLLNEFLRDLAGNERGILLDLWRPSSRAMVQRYVGEGVTWSTVTPVILPGYDDGKLPKAEKLFLKAFEQSGLPLEVLREFVLRKAPFWPGSLHPRHYLRPDYLRHLPAWHAWIRLAEPISGPISVGAGRHCGLGVFARSETDI